jgi:hypothetical protein
MQKQVQVDDNGAPIESIRNGAGKVLDAVQSGAGTAALKTEKAVRKYPLAAVAVALGSGVAVGALVHRALVPRPRRFLERLGIVSALGTAVAAAARGVKHLRS